MNRLARPTPLMNPRSRDILRNIGTSVSWWGALLGMTVLVACGPQKPATVSMRMIGGPPRASVTIDDEYVGALEIVQARGVALPPGKHHVTVEAAGYFPWDRVLDVAEGQGPIQLDARLVRIPD